jgi:sulfotransferase family protein
MLKHLDGYTLWKSPRVGSLFGDFYYDHPASQRGGDRTDHILGPEKETWLGPMRSFILDGIALRFPELTEPGSDSRYLFISEHHGSLGAPLIMEALPESRMLLMMRDPRDVAASTREASKTSGWVRKVEGDGGRTLADTNPIAFMEAHVEQNVRSMGHARQAYDAHQGPKAILKYEDLRADTLAAMRHTLSTLGLRFDEEQLAEAVETYSWENVPEKKKGEGMFHRKATPGGWKEDLSPEEVRIVEEGFESLINEFYADASVTG